MTNRGLGFNAHRSIKANIMWATIGQQVVVNTVHFKHFYIEKKETVVEKATGGWFGKPRTPAVVKTEYAICGEYVQPVPHESDCGTYYSYSTQLAGGMNETDAKQALELLADQLAHN